MTQETDLIFQNMKTRRAVRSFTGAPVSDDNLWEIVQAGRWAASGGNLRPHRFFITRDEKKIGQIRSFSPGMLAGPAAIIAILIDWDQVAREFSSIEPSMIPYVDVGTAAQNMLNMAHALGVGSCPVTSFSQSGVAGSNRPSVESERRAPHHAGRPKTGRPPACIQCAEICDDSRFDLVGDLWKSRSRVIA